MTWKPTTDKNISHHPSQHPSSRGTATALARFSLPSTSILSIFILCKASSFFQSPSMHESMLALSSRRTYDCHLKESERSLTFLLLFLQEWPVVWHLVRNTSQAISPLLSSVILALYVSLLSIQIFDFLNSAGRVLQYHS